jgi:hypothetical protein
MGKDQGSPRSGWLLLGTRCLAKGPAKPLLPLSAPNMLWELDGPGANLTSSSTSVIMDPWGPRRDCHCCL